MCDLLYGHGLDPNPVSLRYVCIRLNRNLKDMLPWPQLALWGPLRSALPLMGEVLFYWGTVASQRCATSCYKAKWISCMCTNIPSLLGDHRVSSGVPALHSRVHQFSALCMAMCTRQSPSPSPSHTPLPLSWCPYICFLCLCLLLFGK